jgi:hypothetical protein
LDTPGKSQVFSQQDEFFATEPWDFRKDSDAPLASVSGNGGKKGALSSGEKIVERLQA